MVETDVQKREANEAGTVERTRNVPTFVPDVDIYEDDDMLFLEADMPGVNEKNLDITIENGVLEIHGAVSNQHAPVEQDLLYHEYHVGNYERSFRVNEEVDMEKVEALIKDGVLTLKLPKSEKAKPVKITPKSE